MKTEPKYNTFCFNEMRYRLAADLMHVCSHGFSSSTQYIFPVHKRDIVVPVALTIENVLQVDMSDQWRLAFRFGEPLFHDQAGEYYHPRLINQDSPKFRLVSIPPKVRERIGSSFTVYEKTYVLCIRTNTAPNADYYKIVEQIHQGKTIDQIAWSNL